MSFWIWQLFRRWFRGWMRFLRLPGECFPRWSRRLGLTRKVSFRTTCRQRRCLLVSLGFDWLEARTAPALTYRLIADINPGAGASQPQNLTNVSGTVFFVAMDGTNSWHLWRSDGTSSGTFLVRQIGSGAFTSRPRYLTNVNGTLFFVANDGTGDKIWRSNGDAASTQRLDSLTTGLSAPRFLANLNNTLFFTANSPTYGRELFRSNANFTAATLVADINSGTASSNPSFLFPFGNKLLFAANDGTSGTELWAHDTLSSQTFRVLDINPGSGHSYPTEFAELDGVVYFSAIQAGLGRELWKTDGSSANTSLVADINPGPGDSQPRSLTNINGRLAFSANTPSVGRELFLFDPATGTPQLVKDIHPTASSVPRSLTNVNGTLFFAANDGQHGYELWQSDLTAAGTILAIDFAQPGNGLGLGDTPGQLVNANGMLFLGANNGSTGLELWLAYEPASIQSVSPPPSGTYGLGSTLTFSIRFSRPVLVSGTPILRFTFDTGSGVQSRDAVYTAGSATDTLTFSYTVQAGDNAPSGITVTSPIQLPTGASITDTAGNSVSLSFTDTTLPNVKLDGVAPTITSVTGPAAGTYIVGQNLDFTVQFDDTVNVTGTPRLQLTIGSTTRYATYVIGSGTSTLTFRYTVQVGDLDSDGIAVASPIDLNGGTIKDTSGNDAVLTFTPPDTSGVLVDGVAPTITSVSGPAAGTYIVGQHLDFTVQFDDTVVVDTTGGTPRLVLTIGSATQYATYLSGSGSNMLVFRYTVQSGDLDTDGIAVASPIDLNGGTITDVPGNNAVLTFTPPDTSGVLVDGVAPTITSVTGPAAGTYIVGQHLDFTVVFSEAVVVNTAGGTPRLQLTIGSTTRYATYLSGSGTSTLTFRYTVQSGDLDSDGIAVASPVDLNGGTIKDVPGNDAVLSFTPPNTSGVLVDGVAPTITSVSGPTAGTYIVGQNLDFTVVFSEAVVVNTAGGTPRLVLTIGSTTRYATYLSGTGTSTLVFRYTVQSGDLDSDGIAVASTSIDLNGGTITDVPGNDAVLTFTPPDTSSVLVDGVAPTITSVTGPTAGTYIVGQNLDFTVVFSEAVVVNTAGGTPRLVLTIGSTTRYATYLSGTGTSTLVFRYTVQSGDLDSDGIAVASPIDLNGGTIKDTNGNDAVLSFTAPDTSGVLVDGVAPTITSVTGPTAGTYIVGQHLDFTVVFSEAVAVDTTGGTPQLVLTIGSATRYATYQSGSGTSTLVFRYTVQAGDEDSDGIAVASPIDLNGGTIKDTNGNDAVLSFTAPDTSSVLVDGVAPTITSVSGPTAGTYIVGQNLDFTVDFDDIVNVTGTPRLVLTIGSTTQYATYQSGSGTSTLVFRYTVQAGDLDSDGIAVASPIDLNGGTIKDTNGNNAVLTFTPPDTSSVLVDGVAPTTTSVTGPAPGTYGVGQNLDFTVQFSEAVAVTGTPRLVLTIGSATRYATYVSGSGSASLLFRYTVQAGDLDSDGIAVASPIDLNGGTIKDVPGNNAVLTFTPPNTSGVLVDGVAPTITSVTGPAAGTYIVGQNLDFTVVFSEAVVVNTAGGTPRLVLTIGSTTRYATYVSGSGSASLLFRYTVQSGDLDSDGIAVASPIDLNGGTITDVPGNDAVLTFTPPNTSGVLVDGVAPTITSVTGPAAGTYIVGQHLDFTVQFDETVVVDTTGTPRLQLTIGSTTRYATYLSGTGTSTLTFRYTVQSGDLDTDGIAVASSIGLNGGTITDVPGNDAVLTFTPPDTSSVLVDGVAPTITSVTGPAAGTYIVGQNLDFTVQFDEAVVVDTTGGTPRLQLTIGSTTRYATYVSGSGSASLLFRYTVQSGDLDSDGIAVASPIDLNGGTIRDVPGNNAVLTFTPPDTSGVLVDGVAPTITSVSGPAAGTYIVGQNLDFTVQFDDTVVVDTAGGTPRLVLTIGSATQYATYQSGTGTSTLVFSYTVQAGDEDSDGIAVASPIDLNGGTIKDVPGNNTVLSFTPPDTSGVLVDGVAPTITSVAGPAAGTYIVGQHLDFTVVFSEAVAVTGTPRLVLTIGSTTRYATYVSGSGSASLLFRYTVQAGDLDSDGIAVASPIDLNGGTIKDVPGNDAVLSFTAPDTSGVLVDGVAPTITSVTGPAAGTYIVGQSLVFTVDFDDIVNVTGTPRLVLTIGSATQYATYLSGTGTSTLVFRYTVQPGDLDSDGIAVASSIDLNGGTIKDVPGNNAVLTFTAPDTSSVLVDGVAPTITSVSGPAAGTYIVGQHLDFTVVFSEAVAVTGTPRLQLTIGSTTRYATYVSGSGSAICVPLHGAIGRPGQRWHCRCIAD
jgi:ELWxxDGT repeat protein